MRRAARRVTVVAGFALLALVAELTGRELTDAVDRALHVAPLATPSTPYYPFLLVGVKVLAGIGLAMLAWRLIRAHSTAVAGQRLLANFVRQRGLNTNVSETSECYSACTFVFIGGVKRTILGKFGIHRMSMGGDGKIHRGI